MNRTSIVAALVAVFSGTICASWDLCATRILNPRVIRDSSPLETTAYIARTGTSTTLVAVTTHVANLSAPPSFNLSTKSFGHLGHLDLQFKPTYISAEPEQTLNTWDFSTHQARGEIPQSIHQLQKLQYVYLESKQLTATIPELLVSNIWQQRHMATVPRDDAMEGSSSGAMQQPHRNAGRNKGSHNRNKNEVCSVCGMVSKKDKVDAILQSDLGHGTRHTKNSWCPAKGCFSDGSREGQRRRNDVAYAEDPYAKAAEQYNIILARLPQSQKLPRAAQKHWNTRLKTLEAQYLAKQQSS